MPKASQGQRLASCRRAPVKRRATSIATPSPITVYLVSRPIPKTSPSSSHSRGFVPRSSRTKSKHATTQTNSSKLTVWNRMFVPMNIGEISTASPVRLWARPFPPSSRAIRAAMMMMAAPARTVSKRNPGSEPGKIAWSTLASSGVIGG